MSGEWAVKFSISAERDFARLDSTIRRRIIEKLEWLEDHFDETVSDTLHGEFSEFLKLRVGDWRVVYTVAREKRIITVHYIDHRDKIYKRKL